MPGGGRLYDRPANIRRHREVITVFIEPHNPALDDEVNEWYEDQSARWGYLPNYAPAFASRPDVARTWAALNTTIRNGMDARRYEIATIAAARALRNTYCTAAHSKFLRDSCNDESTMLSIAEDPDGTSLADADRAVMAFARKVALDAASVTPADIEELHAAGLSDNDIADVVFAAAARSFFTRVLDGFGIQADHQLGAQFEPAVVERFVVGRPIASPPAP
jgi:uncharacterized peroxidase-related enzyme